MKESIEKPKLERLVGEINRILFFNQDNGYQILKVTCPTTFDENVVTINYPKIHEGVTMEFKGNWTTHPKFGNQFKAVEGWEVPPSTKEGLIAFLSSNFFDGIGPVKARRIVNTFGDDTYNVLDNNIERLLEVRGITERLLEKIRKSWLKNSEIRDIMIFLQSHDISATLASKIYEEYQHDCVRQLKENPYDMVYKVKGIGFLIADKIAISLGFELNHPLRIDACIVYTLNQAGNKGHCYLDQGQVHQETQNFLGSELESYINQQLVVLEREGNIHCYEHSGQKRYYSKRTWHSETYVADKLELFISKGQTVFLAEEFFTALAQKGTVLSEEQEESVKAIVKNRISVLTGGPGTGKSYTTKSVLDALDFIGTSYLLAAPTGKAAKRMKELTGREASTIHMALGWDPIGGGFIHNEDNQLPQKFYVLDETSMLDIHLAADLFRAIPNDAQVLLVGDVDQLPPVGAGNPFRDAIESGLIPVLKLTKVFRQGKGSEIITFSHQINEGEIPMIENPLTDPELWTNGTECLFIDSGFAAEGTQPRDYPSYNSLRYGMNVLEMIDKLYIETIPKYFGSNEKVQILIPMRIGPIGTIEVNKRIQNLVNPAQHGKHEIIAGGTLFRTGDRVIQTSNNYELRVFNGDVGKIEYIDHVGDRISIRFDDTVSVFYTKKDMEELELSYAISIHKSQGSEFEYVIMPLTMSYYRMLFRNLIYTGLTRAKKFAIFVGERKAMNVAVHNANYVKRQTSLKEFLKKEDVFLG